MTQYMVYFVGYSRDDALSEHRKKTGRTYQDSLSRAGLWRKAWRGNDLTFPETRGYVMTHRELSSHCGCTVIVPVCITKPLLRQMSNQLCVPGYLSCQKKKVDCLHLTGPQVGNA